MKIDLRVGDEKRDIVCSPDVIWLGISSDSIAGGMNISKYLEYYSNKINLREETVAIPNDKDVTLLFYSSEDEELHNLLLKYKGLRILEFRCKEMEIVATV